MENFKVTMLDVIIRNDELAKCKDEKALKIYLDEVVAMNIFNYLSTQPKGWEVGVGCSTDRGCDVRVGGSWNF